MNLLQMSFFGAVMILVIAVIRALAVNKLPKRTFLALWSVVAVRLLIPYSLHATFSVYSLFRRPASMGEAVKDGAVALFTPTVVKYNMASVPGATVTEATAAVVNPWIIVWIAGALACAVYCAAAYLKCCKEFKASLPVDNEYVKLWQSEHCVYRAAEVDNESVKLQQRRYCIYRTIEIRQSDRIFAPLTYGIFHPVILMPKTTDWDDSDTLKYVLGHEYVHIRRFDAVTKLVLTVTLCIHWFNPVVWIMYVLANRDIELSCDEAVIRRFGECAKSAYAMALICMEETRSRFVPLCNNFSKNAIEERIIAIMKIRKTSLAALIAATVLVVGMTAAFATSAKADENLSMEDLDRRLDAAGTVTEDSMMTSYMTSYVDPRDGKTYYSFDGGKTFEAMTEEEVSARFPTPDIEWWTYDEYKAWLENEKTELQDIIGEKAWNSGRGDFVWTQEMVDETIAMYEEILEGIKRGMLYSKTIYGEDGTSLMMSMNPADIWMDTHEAIATSADFTQYAPFGLVWDNSEKALYLNGQRVRYFLDGAEVDGSGGMSIYLEYADAELKGDIDVRTVRERVQNADGSVNVMGPLKGLEKYSQAEFDARIFDAPSLDAVTYAYEELARDVAETEALLEVYAPFGLSYKQRFHPIDGELELRMSWQGKPVHSIYDATTGVWIANSMRGLYLDPNAVDLEAVYEQGKLIGLQEIQSHAVTEISFEAEGNSTSELGTSFAELFEKYTSFGITYVEAKGASGAGNVYYNGQLVSRFADLTPDGGAFTFSSAEQDGITVKTVYDKNGRLAGVEAVVE